MYITPYAFFPMQCKLLKKYLLICDSLCHLSRYTDAMATVERAVARLPASVLAGGSCMGSLVGEWTRAKKNFFVKGQANSDPSQVHPDPNHVHARYVHIKFTSYAACTKLLTYVHVHITVSVPYP